MVRWGQEGACCPFPHGDALVTMVTGCWAWGPTTHPLLPVAKPPAAGPVASRAPRPRHGGCRLSPPRGELAACTPGLSPALLLPPARHGGLRRPGPAGVPGQHCQGGSAPLPAGGPWVGAEWDGGAVSMCSSREPVGHVGLGTDGHWPRREGWDLCARGQRRCGHRHWSGRRFWSVRGHRFGGCKVVWGESGGCQGQMGCWASVCFW